MKKNPQPIQQLKWLYIFHEISEKFCQPLPFVYLAFQRGKSRYVKILDVNFLLEITSTHYGRLIQGK